MMRYALRPSDWHKFGANIRFTDTCWIWTGFIDQKGYGRYSVKAADGKRSHVSEGAYRIAWILKHCRDIPHGMHVLHSCDNPACVKPDHLRLGTHAENMWDMKDRGRANGRCPPEKAHSAKMNWSRVAELRAMKAANPEINRYDLAALFGITPSNVSYILNGKTWRVTDTASGGERASEPGDGTIVGAGAGARD